MNYFKLHIGDYLRDAAHLSMLEHGAYNRLLHVYYRREAPVPADQVMRLVGAKSKDELAAVNSVLSEFFALDGNVWRHKRCEAEIAAYQAKANKNRVSGQKGGRPKRTETETDSEQEPRNNPDGFQKEPSDNPNVTLATSHKPEEEDSEDLRGLRSSARSAPSGDPPIDPRTALFTLGKSLLGTSAGGLISAAIARAGERRVAQVLGEMAMSAKAEPRAWFAKSTQVGHSEAVV